MRASDHLVLHSFEHVLYQKNHKCCFNILDEIWHLCFCLFHQELKKLGLESEVDLHVYEVPVEYQKVQSLVPSLWKQYHPQVMGTLSDLSLSFH